MRRYLPYPVLLFLILWIGLLIVGRASLFADPGVFWHTVLGSDVLNGLHLTTRDTFSYTYAGQPWLSLQWLAEWGMAAAHAWGGWDTMLLATATLLAAFYTWLGARLTRCGLHPLLASAAVLTTIAASSHHFHARPHLGSIIFLGLTFGLLCDVEAGRVRPVRMLWLVPLFVLWTNVHGGVLAGVASLGLVVAGWTAWQAASAISRRRGWLAPGGAFPSPLTSPGQLVLAWLVVATCAAAMLVNPYGTAMLEAWLTILRMPLTGLIVEHRPLAITSPVGILTAALGLAYAALLIDTLRHRGWQYARITWLLPLVWLLLAWSRIRHGPLFAAVGAIAFAELLPYSRLATWLAQFDLFTAAAQGEAGDQRKPMQAQPPARTAVFKTAAFCQASVIPVGLVILALILQHLRVLMPVLGANWARLEGARWPVALLPELKDLEAEAIARRNAALAAGLPVSGAPLRLFNALDYGGFLIYYTPNLKTFIDDRCELYGTEFLSRYVEAEQGRGELLEAWDQQYGFDAALVHAGSPLDRYLAQAPGWELVRRAESGALYRRAPAIVPPEHVTQRHE